MEILDRITSGNGSESDLDKLEEISTAMAKASLCMLGGTAANPTISTVQNYREEYLEHIHDRKCRAGKCKKLVRYEIDKVKCKGCGLCVKKCPADCITGEKKQPYTIEQSKCLKCGECLVACKFDAVLKC